MTFDDFKVLNKDTGEWDDFDIENVNHRKLYFSVKSKVRVKTFQTPVNLEKIADFMSSVGRENVISVCALSHSLAVFYWGVE